MIEFTIKLILFTLAGGGLAYTVKRQVWSEMRIRPYPWLQRLVTFLAMGVVGFVLVEIARSPAWVGPVPNAIAVFFCIVAGAVGTWKLMGSGEIDSN